MHKRVTTRTVDLTVGGYDVAGVAMLDALREVLDAADHWDVLDEGTWEEYAKPGGVNYAPDFDIPVPTRENREELHEVRELTRQQIAYWEARIEDAGGEVGTSRDATEYFVRL